MVDNCLATHEVLSWVKKRNKGTLYAEILKVDLSEAYDRIRWDFLEAILINMNFPEQWVTWIKECLSTVSYLVLMNGEPTPFFKTLVGLRQGDLLSPYLFILCAWKCCLLISLQLMKPNKSKD